jgi:crotonobetainyl-CoA:carnitine CoA-transferase CaiB-like acyl-CoA transferase
MLEDDAVRGPTLAQNYAVTRLKDGFCAGSAVSDSQFRGWCIALGHPEVGEDPRFSSLGARIANSTELVAVMGGFAAETTVDEFLTAAIANDVPAAAINSLASLVDDPQIRHNGTLVERTHPVAGRMREPRPAPQFSATPARLGSPAPTYGQHSDEIATQLGLDAAALRAAGVIA